MGLRGGATFFDSSSARISWMISKHSSRSDEQMACDAGILPPGPRNFPSTRFLHVSECDKSQVVHVTVAEGEDGV